MLEVKGIAPTAEAELELDNLVVNLEWPVSTAESPYYWRTGNFQESLLEIGLHQQTGQLVSVTLVNIREFNPPLPEIKPLDKLTEKVILGVPLFGLPDSPSVDEQHELNVTLAKNRLTIWWGTPGLLAGCVKAGRVLFGVDENDALWTVQITQLSSVEIAAIWEMFS